MATAYLAPAFNQAFPEAPLGWLHTYDVGTVTPKAAYQNQAGTVSHELPTAGVPLSGIHLDAYGRPPGGFFLSATGEYTLHLYAAAGTLVKSWDDVGGSGTDVIARLASTASADEGDALVAVKREETGAAGRTLHFYVQRSKLQVSNFCDPSSDTPSQVATALAAAITAAKAGQKVLEFEPGATYTTNAATNFLGSNGLKGLRYWGNGCTIYRSSGSGPVATLDSGGATDRTSDIEFADFVLKGNASSTYGLYLRGMGTGGRIQKLRVVDVATAGYLIEWAVCVHFSDLYLSAAIDTFTVNPATGMIVTRSSAGLYTAACTFKNIVLENPITDTSLDLVYSGLNNCFDGGTFESVPRGLRHRSTARDTIIRNIDFEGNTDFDALVEGEGIVFENVNSGSSSPAQGNILLAATASRPVFRGGYFRRIDIDAAASGVQLDCVAIDDNPSVGLSGAGTYASSHGAYYVDTSVAEVKTVSSYIPDRLGPSGVPTYTITQGVTPTRDADVSQNSYKVSGENIFVQGHTTFTSAGTGGSAVLVGLPAALTASAASVDLPVGSFIYNDGGTRYAGAVVLQAATELSFITNTGTSLFGTSPAITIANGDTLSFTAFYPLA